MKRLMTFFMVIALVAVPAAGVLAQDDMEMECFGSEGSEISILGQWSGEEEETFRSILDPVLSGCELSLSYEGTRDQATVLATRIEGGSPPDIAILPNPGSLVNYVDAMVSLDEIGISNENYAEGSILRGSIDGTWYGLHVKTDVKSLVWYSPANFEAFGFEPPTTWSGFMDFMEMLNNETETPPLSIGLASGGTTGWPATDTIQDILLRTQGKDFVNGLISGETDWNDPAMIETWNMYVDWVEMYNAGGTDAALTINFNDAILRPFQDPPEAWMVRQSGFAGSATIAPNFEGFEYGTDFAFFVLPGPDGEAVPMQLAGDFMAAFNNTPAVQAVLTFLASPAGASTWAQAGFDLTPNTSVNPEDYPDQLTRDKASALADAPDVSFDIGDSLPAEVGQAEFEGITEAVGGGDVEEILNGIEETFTETVESDGM